jgi:hypothetical protein
MTIVRKPRSTSQTTTRPRFAVAIDQRTGFKHKQKEMMFEPGTNYYVHRKESDGPRNLVSDQLNYPSAKLNRPERIALRHPSPDVPLFLGVVISADQLGLPSHASTFYSSTVWPSIGVGICVAPPSVGAQISAGRALNFSNPLNSQYYVIIFQGI